MPKEKKPWLWICISLILVITTAVFAYLYFTNQNNPETAKCVEPVADPTDGPADANVLSTYAKRDIDKTIAILLPYAQEGQFIKTGPSILTQDISLLKNGNINKETKAGSIVWSLPTRDASINEKDSIIAIMKQMATRHL